MKTPTKTRRILVDCPDCGNANRHARRRCKARGGLCGGAGQVWKTVPWDHPDAPRPAVRSGDPVAWSARPADDEASDEAAPVTFPYLTDEQADLIGADTLAELGKAAARALEMRAGEPRGADPTNPAWSRRALKGEVDA